MQAEKVEPTGLKRGGELVIEGDKVAFIGDDGLRMSLEMPGLGTMSDAEKRQIAGQILPEVGDTVGLVNKTNSLFIDQAYGTTSGGRLEALIDITKGISVVRDNLASKIVPPASQPPKMG